MKIDLKINSWEQVTINVYRQIVKICEDESLSPEEKDLGVLAILCEVPEEDLWELTVSEVNELRLKMRWLGDFSYRKRNLTAIRKVKIGDISCDVCYDVKGMSYAQYVDFKGLWKPKDWVSNLEQVISTFVIPSGHKYNDGYDIAEFQQAIADNLSITTANSLFFSLVKKWGNSIRASRRYLVLRMKMMKMMKKPMSQKLMKQAEELRDMIVMYFSVC